MVDRPSRRAAATALRRISYAVDSDTDDASISVSENENTPNKSQIRSSVSPKKRRQSSPPATPRRSSRRASAAKEQPPNVTSLRVEIPVKTGEWPHLDLDEDGVSSSENSRRMPSSRKKIGGAQMKMEPLEKAFARASNKSSQPAAASSSKRKRAKIESDDDYADDGEDVPSDDDAYEELADVKDESADDNDAAFDDDEDAMSVVSDVKPKAKSKSRSTTSKSTAKGGVSNTARKKASAAAAEAGNLPPMSDLNEMFRDMITRKPETDDASTADAASSSSGKGKQKTLLDMMGSKGKAKKEDPQEGIFSEPKGVYLRKAVETLGRKLRVATMCR